MASTLRSKAIKNVTKGNTSAYYSYIEERNGVNPVIQQFEKELNDYMGFVKKKNSGLLKPGEHAPCKVADALFDIWNKFEPRVTPRLFYQKLMQIGEYLVENREYSTASWQCYDRYLNLISEIDFEHIQSIEDLKKHFFPNGIDSQENSDMTFRALMGHSICKFHLIVKHDQRLQSTSSVQEITKIMKNLRMLMQLLFEVDHFCWLIYNATIYMYTIGRYMMQYGQSKIVLEYLLFCSLSMEYSVALLNSKYLPWRATLYAATCQCYYDCRYNDDGEIFARRALSKISELHELEMASVTAEKGVEIPQFREATIKIGVVLFKRLVYESRRKSKNVYRPKNRLAYKDLNNQAWPRTGVEKILNEMFDCSSAQILAIEEALNDSNRRIAMPGPTTNDNEPEILDVSLELLFAAEYLTNGGGGKSPVTNDKLSPFSALVTDDTSLISIAVQGNNGVNIRNFLKIVKFAFNHEAWEIFRRISQNIIEFIEKNQSLMNTYKSDVLIIYLLQAADKYHAHLRKLRHIKNEQLKATLAAAKEKSKKDAKNENENTKSKNLEPNDAEKPDESKSKKAKTNLKNGSQANLKVDFAENSKEPDTTETDGVSSPGAADLTKEEDILFNMANKLIQIVDSNIPADKTDYDIVVDITLLLWKKCKEVFQKYQTGSQDNYRWITKLENFSKWLYILNVTHDSMCYFNISSIDPAVFGHCSLRLGLTYESLANINFRKYNKDSASQFEADDQYSVARTNLTKLNFEFSDIASERFGASNDIRGNLQRAKQVLKKALNAISLARATVSRTDKTFLCDKDYNLDFVELGLKTNVKAPTTSRKIEKLKNLKEKPFQYKKNVQIDSTFKLIADLHVELIFLYHKISVRLLQHKDNQNFRGINIEKQLVAIDQEFEILLKECKKSKISQSLLLLSKSLSLTHFHSTDQAKFKQEQRNLIQRAHDRLIKAEIEDEILFKKHVIVDSQVTVKAKIPPAPVVCLRTHDKIVVEPRNFESTDGTKACWYRVFASLSSNVNSKARISDYGFVGSGEQIPAKTSEKVTISGLCQDEQYIFAVAAYDRNGALIGDSIGESTDPILASNTLSILMNWAYLCQVSYQIGDYDMALTAFKTLWDRFIIKPIEPEKETIIIQNQSDYDVSFHQLNYEIIEKTSPILLRKFLECFFIATDIRVKSKRIFCDVLFDGKIQYDNQIDRVRECENLLVAIELASWLNDAPIILQAVVQCYGLLAPLIYFNLAYEPLIKILSHCMLILEDIPVSIFIKKPKNTFESLQHMIACTTFYLTDILKRLDRKMLANYFNSIGRKLLGMEETSNEPEDPEPEDADNKQKKLKGEKVPPFKQNELRALENHLAKSNVSNRNAFFSMLTGNEDISQIYSFISNNSVKVAYKELMKFRKRNNYFEILINLMQKALNEETNQEINEWSLETIDWLQKRNASILGINTVVKKKADAQLSIGGNSQKPGASDMTSEANDQTLSLNNSITTKSKKKSQRKIKKYKLLIPLDLDMNEKIKLEEKQKAAIDLLYDLLPELYEKWTRRKKLRKMFQEESAFKSQFYVIYALSNFGQLMNRVNSNSITNKSELFDKINSITYLDPQNFLFDKNNAIIVNFDETPILKTESFAVKAKKSESKHARIHHSPSKISKSSNVSNDEKLSEVKDTSDLIADILNGIESFPSGEETNRSTTESDNSKKSRISIGEFVEIATSIFDKFKISNVIAHRGKQWTQLQNTCKLMFNCINTFMMFLPALTATNKKVFKIRDMWRALCQSVYLAADNLLDMLLYTNPIEKNIHRDIHNKINKWFDSGNVGKSGASLNFDTPLDDINSIDLRFVKEFIFRSIQCLSSCEKWEKCATLALKFNAMTSYKYAEQLSPIIAFCQHKLIDQISKTGQPKVQKHLERLKAELGRYPRIEDLFFINFKIEIEHNKIDQLELGAKIDPRNHNIYDSNKAKENISVPLDIEQTLVDLKDAMENSLHHSRALLHARRLLSLYLLAKTSQTDFFGVNHEPDTGLLARSDFDNDQFTSSGKVAFEKIKTTKVQTNESEFVNTFFHSNPINFSEKKFKKENELFVKEIRIDLDTIIESYSKCIHLLSAYKENDQAIQAMHELGNVYHYANDLEMAYKYWNDALDCLTGVKNCLINWRKEFSNLTTREIKTQSILKKCGIWGSLLGGVLTSKMAQYSLSNDLELKTECCLLSATFFKCIFRASIPYSRHDFDYSKDDLDFINSDYLLPGLMFNSELFRFDVRYVISALNFVCLELLNAGHYLYTMPSIVLYEYFSKMLCRDMSHTVFARLIKIEALTKLNMFKEAISILYSVHKGDNLPHFIDDKGKNFSNDPKYIDFVWNSGKQIFDLNNLRCLETVLSLKLSFNLIKLYGSHLSTRFYLTQCKLLLQIATCIPCMPNFDEYKTSQLFYYHDSFMLNISGRHGVNLPSSFSNSTRKPNIDDNPDVIKIFSKSATPLSLELIKGCLLGTCKTIISKCLKAFGEDFPKAEKYIVSNYWQKEFKFESHLLLASVADQSHIGYLALQNIFDGMKELSGEENTDQTKEKKTLISALKKNKNNFLKQLKAVKKGVYQIFDSISRSHFNARLWLKARMLFVQFMFNQLNDVGKAKGYDETIVKDFTDLKYYCEKSIEESNEFYDLESKSFFMFIEASLELLRGSSLKDCIKKLDNCILNLINCNQLSIDGLISFLKANILKTDLQYTVNILDCQDSSKGLKLLSCLDQSMTSLLGLQQTLLEELSKNHGESVECYTDKQKSYFDNIHKEIKNVYNPLLHYLVNLKLRLGSCLMIKSSYFDNQMVNEDVTGGKLWEHALNVLGSAIELNKVICERSLSLEIELNYKYSHCIRELFITRQVGTLNDVVESYGYTINLLNYSTHDLHLIKQCYLELAVGFISTFDSSITLGVSSKRNVRDTSFSAMTSATNTPLSSAKPGSKMRKTAGQSSRATEAALTALAYAVKTSNAIREKMLLSGNETIKNMPSIYTTDCPKFVASDLIAYHVFAERKRIYRDEIEEEILSLAPEFEVKENYKTYDDKIELLKKESDQSITWIHVLNYQTKLQNLSSMRNLNTLKNGKNRYKYSEFYTIGLTPIIKSTHLMSSRLYELNNYLKNNLPIYNNECQAQAPITDFFRIFARKSTAQTNVRASANLNTLLQYVRVFNGNLTNNMSSMNYPSLNDMESIREGLVSSQSNRQNNVLNDWSYLQNWPANYNNMAQVSTKINDSSSYDSFADYLLTFNWHKNLSVTDDDVYGNGDDLLCIIAVRDPLTSNKVKFRYLSAEEVLQIHEKLVPLAAIADTSLNSEDAKKNEPESNSLFMNSLKTCLGNIAKLFDKKFDDKKIPFELITSNIADLEMMFNVNFGGNTNNESLKNYILNLFI